MNPLIASVSIGETNENNDDITSSRRSTRRKYVIGGEWFVLIPIQEGGGSVHIVRGNITINQHNPEVPWTENRFCRKRFSRDLKGGEID